MYPPQSIQSSNGNVKLIAPQADRNEPSGMDGQGARGPERLTRPPGGAGLASDGRLMVVVEKGRRDCGARGTGVAVHR